MQLRDKIAAWAILAFLAVGYCHDARAEGLTKGGLLPIGEVAKASSTWTGFYVGAHAGYGVAVGEINVGDDGFLRGLSADGALYGVHAGFDYQFPSSIWVLGVRGGYTWSEMAFEAGYSGGTFSANLKDGWWVDGVVGLGLGAVKPYVFAGWTRVGTGVSLTGLGSASGPDLDGMRLGTGIEWKLPGAPFVTLALDYTYTRYDSIDLCGGCGEVSIDPEDHRVLAKVNFRFGGTK